MPTYEYACKQCGEHLEVVQSFKDEALTLCPNCGGDLRKVFGSIGIVFKGSGFYKTDSRTSGASKTGEKSADKSDKSESGSRPEVAAKTESGSNGDTKAASGAKSDGAGKSTGSPPSPGGKGASKSGSPAAAAS